MNISVRAGVVDNMVNRTLLRSLAVAGLAAVSTFVSFAVVPRLEVHMRLGCIGSSFTIVPFDLVDSTHPGIKSNQSNAASAGNGYPSTNTNCGFVATYGSLSGYGTAQAAANAQHGTQSYFNSGTSGTPCASFTDSVRITSATLPIGTPVVVTLSTTLKSALAATAGYDTHIEAVSSFSVSTGFSTILNFSAYRTTSPVASVPEAQGQLFAAVGSEFIITGGLSLSGKAQLQSSATGPFSSIATGNAEASFKIRVNLQNAGVTSQSGASYK